MTKLRKWALLLTIAGSTMFAGTCASNVRDAVIGGALDYISGSTSGILGNLVPIVDALSAQSSP